MLTDVIYSLSWKHSRHRAQNPGTTLEQLITIGRTDGMVQSDKNGRSMKAPVNAEASYLSTLCQSVWARPIPFGSTAPRPVRASWSVSRLSAGRGVGASGCGCPVEEQLRGGGRLESPGPRDQPFAVEHPRRDPPAESVEHQQQHRQADGKTERGLDHVERDEDGHKDWREAHQEP